MTSDWVVSDLMPPLWEEVLWPFLNAAHNRHAMECLREIRAVRRALLLPFEGTVDGPQGAGSVWVQQPAAWRASLFFLVQKKPALVPDSEAVNSFIGDGFPVPELKGGSEASDDDQADNVSNEAVYVIGLHGSGDKNLSLPTRLGGGKGRPELPHSIGRAVPRFFSKWKRDVVGLDFERACRLSDKPCELSRFV